MEDTLIFVDDGFFGLVKKYFQKKTGKDKKYLQTFRNICKKENLNLKHLFIYSAPPFQSPNPSEEENLLMSRYNNMMKMLKKKKWVTIREGRCQRLLNEKGEFDYYQKGVDASIILDMCDIKETHPSIKKIILIASDSDFVPVIERMKSKGIEIILYTYFERNRKSRFSTSNELLKVASKWARLDESYFDNSLLGKNKNGK